MLGLGWTISKLYGRQHERIRPKTTLRFQAPGVAYHRWPRHQEHGRTFSWRTQPALTSDTGQVRRPKVLPTCGQSCDVSKG